MSKVLVNESNLMAIGAAIRARNGASTTYRPGEMAAAIQAVPNRYGASDEGKVVSSGALVAQTSATKTANGTYDTTTNNEVVVNVAPNLQSKTATQNGTVTPDQGYDGLSSVTVNVSGGGGSAPLLYRLEGFFGNVRAFVSSLNVTLSGTIGETAILIVEHRAAINVTGGMTLIDMSRGSGDYAQYVSVYTKALTNTTETVTITATDSNNNILAAATVYFNRPLSIGAPVQQQMDTGISTYRYTILPSQHMRLAVVNNPYAGESSTHTIEKTRYVLPSNFIGSQNLTFRLIVFLIHDLNENVVLNIGTNFGEADYLNNRIFLYEIT